VGVEGAPDDVEQVGRGEGTVLQQSQELVLISAAPRARIQKQQLITGFMAGDRGPTMDMDPITTTGRG